MKRLTVLLLAACLCAALFGGCSHGDGGRHDSIAPPASYASDELLYSEGLRLALLLGEMVDQPEYLNIMSASPAILDVLKPLQGKDFGQPESVYKASVEEDALLQLVQTAELDWAGFSSTLQRHLIQKMLVSVPTMLNGFAGTETLAAASICAASGNYIGENLEKPCYFLYLYPDACPVMVCFYSSDNLIESNAFLLPDSGLTKASLDALAELFASVGLEEVQIEPVEISQE